MKSHFRIILLAVVAWSPPVPSSAQPDHTPIAPRMGVHALPAPLLPSDRRLALRTGLRRDDVQGSLALTLMSTTALGIAGGLAGGALGHATAPNGVCGDSDCGFGQAVLGVLVGISFGTGLGAHIGNGSRGNIGLDLVGGVLGVGAGVTLMAVGGGDTPGVNIFIPIPMILIPVLFERSGAKRNFRKRTLSASVAPAPGGLAVALAARW